MKLYTILSGGLGNRYFQTLAGIKMSKFSERDLCLVETNLVSKNSKNITSDIFNFDYPHTSLKLGPLSFLVKVLNHMTGYHLFNTMLKRFGILFTKDVNSNLREDASKRVWLVSGYFQNCHNFESLSPGVRVPTELKSQIELLRQSNSYKDVVLHMRLGDYSSDFNPQGILSKDYYTQIFETMPNILTTEIYVVSDDVELSLEILRSNFPNLKFVSGAHFPAPLVDLAILATAKRLICANSSFSLTAALINDVAECIYMPTPFYKQGLFDLKSFPNHWTPIEHAWG